MYFTQRHILFAKAHTRIESGYYKSTSCSPDLLTYILYVYLQYIHLSQMLIYSQQILQLFLSDPLAALCTQLTVQSLRSCLGSHVASWTNGARCLVSLIRGIWFHQPEVFGYLGYFWTISVVGWQKLPPTCFFRCDTIAVIHRCGLSLGISFGMGKSAQEARLVAVSWTWPRLIRYKEMRAADRNLNDDSVEISRIS